MSVVIDEVVADVREEPRASETRAPSPASESQRTDLALELRRMAVRAARVHAD